MQYRLIVYYILWDPNVPTTVTSNISLHATKHFIPGILNSRPARGYMVPTPAQPRCPPSTKISNISVIDYKVEDHTIPLINFFIPRLYQYPFATFCLSSQNHYYLVNQRLQILPWSSGVGAGQSHNSGGYIRLAVQCTSANLLAVSSGSGWYG